MSDSNNVGKPNSGVAPQKGKGPYKPLPKLGGSSKQTEPSADAPPKWALALMGQIENMNSRLGLIETKGFQPKSFSEAAGKTPATSARTEEPKITAGPAQQDQAANTAPKPPKGVSGSGFTRIPNGKLVRNKRPAVKPLPLRQAKNWRAKATTNLVAFLKERGIGSDDAKPTEDTQYRGLVSDLENSKAYLAYVKSTNEPVQVHEFKGLLPDLSAQIEQAKKPNDSVNAVSGAKPVQKSSAVVDFRVHTENSEASSSNAVKPAAAIAADDDESSEEEEEVAKPPKSSPPAKAGPTLRQKGKTLVDRLSASK